MADKQALEPELSWSDHEKDQTWVPRYTDELRMETPLWRYCVSRHKQRWLGTKRHLGPPTSYSEGKGIGWWFPTIWTEEFKPGITGPTAPASRSTNPMPNADWKRPWPELKEFQRWGLPVGTIIVAANSTVIYPNGVIEGWASVQQRSGKPALKPAEPEKALEEEVAATPSPELIEAMRRKEWLQKREQEGDLPPDTSDPQAWRFEMSNT